MFITSLQPEELRILTTALEELCALTANESQRDRVKDLLIVVAEEGVTCVADVVERVRQLLRIDAAAA